MKPVSFEIVESDSRGKIAVATKDLLPGELVLEEKKPLLYFTHDFMMKDNNAGLDFMMKITMASFETFGFVLSEEDQAKFLTLYGPTTGTIADNVRAAAKHIPFDFGDGEGSHHLSPAGIETFVKVASVTRLNMFGIGDDDGYAVFAEITRFAHSCDANCTYIFSGKSCLCYTNRSVKAGEELTIPYIGNREVEPTHERRHKYLEAKEFTCHCPRCDALGDDTRQFDCTNPACKGVMMACQPINKKEVRFTGAPYDGVEYVEPHLLPCNVCHNVPSATYQTKMFALEAQLPDLGEQFASRLSTIMNEVRRDEMGPLFREIQSIKFPRRHAAAFLLLRCELDMKYCLNMEEGSTMRAAVRQATYEFIAVHESIFPHPSPTSVEAVAFVSSLCTNVCRTPIFTPQEVKDLCQKAIRMRLIDRGRNNRDEKLDQNVMKALGNIVVAPSVDRCALCDESPLRAALTLSRCGRCKKVVYCSAGCQKVHWKLHKKVCKAESK